MSSNRSHAAGGRTGHADSHSMSDMPTKDDAGRISKARQEARARYADIEAKRNAEAVAVFRAQLADVVRSASLVLTSLLAAEGLTLNDVIALMDPAQPWSSRLPLSLRSFSHRMSLHWLRYYIAGLPPDPRSAPPMLGHAFHEAQGNYLRMKVIDHSLEVEARIAPVSLKTRFGELRVQLDEPLPHTLAIACVGRMFDEIVDHPAWHGRGWRIVEVEDPEASNDGQTLIVAAGSVPYRITWPQSTTRGD